MTERQQWACGGVRLAPQSYHQLPPVTGRTEREKNWEASPEHRRDECTLLNCSGTHPPALQLNGERKNPQHLLVGREMKRHLLTKSETPTHTVLLLPVTNINMGPRRSARWGKVTYVHKVEEVNIVMHICNLGA